MTERSWGSPRESCEHSLSSLRDVREQGAGIKVHSCHAGAVTSRRRALGLPLKAAV